MILKYLSDLWAAITANHLGQPTPFAVVAGSPALARLNQAWARYRLWREASVKFLISFSLLVGIGSRLVWAGGKGGRPGRLYFAMKEMSQPFAEIKGTEGLEPRGRKRRIAGIFKTFDLHSDSRAARTETGGPGRDPCDRSRGEALGKLVEEIRR